MFRFVLLLLPATLGGAGVELQIQFSAIQKVLFQQMFTQDGRMYVKGTPANRCSFAYLESPNIDGASNRLQIRARFNGRNAASFLGRCWGLGDAFDMRIEAAPYFASGLIRLKEVKVETAGKDTLYARKVRAAITDNLAAKFSYRVEDEAKRMLERKRDGEPYQQQLHNFSVSQIRVTPAALVLTLEFTLVVK